jgi:hypothetical protein
MATHNNESVIDGHELSFDASDPLNGSLYLCEPLGSRGIVLSSSLLDALREAGIWSADAPKSVPDEQRSAYKEQLVLVDTAAYQQNDVAFLIARFDHLKYPSDAARWDAWTAFFDSRFEHLGKL